MASKYPNGKPTISEPCCPVCLEKYRDPRSLICAHTFCENCIHEYIVKQKAEGRMKDGIVCPLCRKQTFVTPPGIPPEKWSKTLPGNYALQGAIESFQKDERKDDELCKVCKKKKLRSTASKYCIQCKKEFCDDCEKIHSIFDHFESHIMVDIGDKSTLQTIPPALDQCIVHGKPIEFYCVDENKLCCSSCAIGKHRKCSEVTEIVDMAEKQTGEIEQPMMSQMRELTSRASKVNRFFENRETNMDIQIQAIDKKLVDEHDKIIDMLKLSRAKILADAAHVKDTANSKYKLHRDQCDDLTSSVEESVRHLTVVRKHGTPSQLFIALHKQEIQLAKYLRRSEEQFADLKYVDIFAESEDVIRRFVKAQSLWKLETYELEKNVDEISDYWKIKLELVASVDVKAQHEDEKIPLYTGMEFFSDGRLIVIDSWNCKCLLMNEQLETLASYKHTTHIYGVASVTDTGILLTGVNTLEQLKLDGDEFIHEGSIQIKSRALSVSKLDNEQLVIGTFDSKQPVKIACKTGEEKYFELKFPAKDWKIDDSRCAYDTETKKLVVTDKLEHKVYIYDAQNNTEVIIDDDRIREPRGVAFGPFQCIFVCSSGIGCIVQLSMFGEILDTHVLGMEFPGTMCFSKCKSILAISNYASQKKKLHRFKVVPSNQ